MRIYKDGKYYIVDMEDDVLITRHERIVTIEGEGTAFIGGHFRTDKRVHKLLLKNINSLNNVEEHEVKS